MKKTIILTFSLMLAFVAMIMTNNMAFAAEEGEEITETEYDTEAPVIYGVSEYTVTTKSKLSMDALKAALTIVDNVDTGLEPLLFEDYYSDNWQTPGTYLVTFKAKDTAGNYGTFIVTIHVVDTTAPMWTDKDGKPISSYSVIKSPNSIFILSEVLADVVVTDDIDGTIAEVKKVEDTYTGLGDKDGQYKIVLIAVDSSGNSSRFTINIQVTSSIPSKTIIMNKKQIIVENDAKLTNEDFSNILKVCGYINTNTTTYVDIDATSYQDLSTTPGDYIVQYQLTTTAGTTQTGSLNVKVCDSRLGDGTIISEADGIFKRIINWIWNLLKKIGEFLVNLFK